MKRARKVLVAIVNYRTAELALDCLRSLAGDAAAIDGLRAIVVDNASRDGSAERIAAAIAAEGLASFAELLALPDNGGFAAGNNAAIRAGFASGCEPEYVLFLNPDTYVRPGAVRVLIDFMDAHPAVGIAGSRLEFPDGEQQDSRFRFPTILGELESAIRLGVVSRLLSRWQIPLPLVLEPERCGWVAGASMIVRGSVIAAIGLMDPGYFLYYEETDYCLRAARAGWPCWYVPAARVVHLVGRSTGVTSADSATRRRPRYWFESRRRYFERNHGRAYAALADLAWFAGFALWRARRYLQRKPDPDPPHLLWDFVRFRLSGAHGASTLRQ